MNQRVKNIFYSFPVQLVLLHIKKFQVLLIFWLMLFGAVQGSFMGSFGVNSLYLAPEYLGEVNAISTFIVGISVGIFIMSWNITTFILFSRHFKFLATTTRPFLKYCTNNFVLPLCFLLFYFFNAFSFAKTKELMSSSEILLLSGGFLCGFIFIIAISFLYFFRADVTIARRMIAVTETEEKKVHKFKPYIVLNSGGSRLIKVTTFLNSPTSVKPVREVGHYSKEFIESIFSRHHFSAVLSIFISFIFLIAIGFFMDRPSFQLPAAASITLFFSILVAVAGAFSYFLQSWSVPFLIVLIIVVNLLFKWNIIDPSNKAYGLNYRTQKAVYTQENIASLCTADKIQKDKATTIAVLNAWKQKQKTAKPYLYIISVSGGGTRSATFTFNTLQKLDSVSKGALMQQTFMIAGASGGMLGAAYYRSLYQHKIKGDVTINLQDRKYVEDISKDLLNPTFSSFVARDLASPAQKFSVGHYSYIKDRGYSFEQKLNENTRYMMNTQLQDMATDERKANIPLMFFNAVVTRDTRKLLISTLPVSYMMKPQSDILKNNIADCDVIDYGALFAKQNAMNLRLLTALRMNATFPYVLPNVWLPTTPVIDVMDAGLRDNYGIETALRFTTVFNEWIKENTAGVVLLQIRDRKAGGWDFPFESSSVSEIATKPLLLLQYNWYKMQQYNQNDLLSYSSRLLDNKFQKISFQYLPERIEKGAALNFHLTKSEKLDIAAALKNSYNTTSLKQFEALQK
jgi:Patatin-like phospholipase